MLTHSEQAKEKVKDEKPSEDDKKDSKLSKFKEAEERALSSPKAKELKAMDSKSGETYCKRQLRKRLIFVNPFFFIFYCNTFGSNSTTFCYNSSIFGSGSGSRTFSSCDKKESCWME